MSNRNRSRTHGGKAWLRHGVLPVGKKRIGREVDQLMAEMVQDLGGPGEITAAQRVLLSVIRQDLIYLALVSEWANAQESIITKRGDVLGALGTFFLAAQGVVTRNCEKLGLKRVTPVQTLEKYLENRAKAAETTSDPSHRPRRTRTTIGARESEGI